MTLTYYVIKLMCLHCIWVELTQHEMRRLSNFFKDLFKIHSKLEHYHHIVL